MAITGIPLFTKRFSGIPHSGGFRRPASPPCHVKARSVKCNDPKTFASQLYRTYGNPKTMDITKSVVTGLMTGSQMPTDSPENRAWNRPMIASTSPAPTL